MTSSASEQDRLARILLSHCPTIGPARFRRLGERFGSAAEALEAGPGAWKSVEGFTPSLADALEGELSRARTLWGKEVPLMEKAGVRALVPSDEGFPGVLNSLDDAPFILYIQGDWRPVDALAVAVVGSRRPTAYGRAAAERLARELAEAGVTVVSGLARGIDAAAHDAVLKRKGRTVGVLGGGMGRFYPPEHRGLAARMAEQGAVVSEYPWFAEPVALNFPRRNRIIAGLSLGVVVVEADVRSGALITARLAAEQGRDVFAVPGSVFSPMSRGPHRLLKEGARPVEDAEDVLDALEVFRDLVRRRAPAAPAPSPAVSGVEEKLLESLSLEPVGADALARSTEMAPGALASALLNLELKGLIKSLPGRAYVRAGAALERPRH
jgi:DNA processing protein